MSSIDKVGANEAARTYVQNLDASRTAAPAKQADKARHHHQQHGSAPKADSVTLSDSARSLAAARQAVEAAPDVRAEKVADIKQKVTDGTYTVSAKVLARKMVDAAKGTSDQA
jgi:negative regulator of flagellin synthesis FlgM